MNFSFVNRVVFDVWNLICLIVVLSCWHLPPFPYLNVIPCLLLFVYFHFSDSWSDLTLVCLWFYYDNSVLYPVLRIYVFEHSPNFGSILKVFDWFFTQKGEELSKLRYAGFIIIWRFHFGFLLNGVCLIVIFDFNKF